jgi:uncharacterized membrane protein YphA (DoxX/SURF4 family)
MSSWRSSGTITTPRPITTRDRAGARPAVTAGRELTRTERWVAAVLAAVWLVAGGATVVVGATVRPAAVTMIVGLLALAYGVIWSRVAATGRRQEWPRRRRSKEGGRGAAG